MSTLNIKLKVSAEVVARQFRWRAPRRNWSPWQFFVDETPEEIEKDCRTPAFWNLLSDDDAAKVEVEFRALGVIEAEGY